jgi:predicted Kef-type K+ transport protein
MLLKTVFTTFVLERLGLSHRHALLIGVALGQLGEFSFVLAALGLSIGAINQDEYKTLVAIIALSLVITPLWMKILHHKQVTRPSARKQDGVDAKVEATLPPAPDRPEGDTENAA